jgi:plastocyanin
MNKNILLLLLMPLFFSSITYKQNEVKGFISFSDCSKWITKGKQYNADGTEILHSDNPLAIPDRNTIISLHPLDFTPKLLKTENAYVTQQEQTFIPHVLPVVVGSNVHFLNEDEFFHNVQSYTPKNRFSIGRRAPGVSYSIKIRKTGVIDLKCDIHAHMHAKILSFETPFFCRVNEDGSYSIKNLPDGNYRLQVFHPTCENRAMEISVKGGQVAQYDFNLSIRP